MPTLRRLLGARRQAAVAGLVAAAERSGQELYLAGGFLRDRLSGLRPKAELDLTVADPGRLLAAAKPLRGGTAFLLDKARATWRLAFPPASPLEHIDITSLRGPSIADDLGRRDFTVNALAVGLSSGTGRAAIIDPTGGGADLRRGLLRPCSESSFSDDPLRILRGFRLAATGPFRLTKEALAQGARHGGRITTVSGERIRQELFQILQGPRPREGLSSLVRAGLLGHLAAAFGQTGSPSLPLAGRVVSLLGELDRRSVLKKKIQSSLEQDVTGRGLVVMAAFLRDRGGTGDAADISRSLLLGRRASAGLRAIVTSGLPARWLLDPAAATRSDLYELYRSEDDWFEEILLLTVAAELPRRLRKKHASRFMTRYARARRSFRRPPLLSGEAAMRHFGLPPGKALGDLLESAKEKQDLGLFKDLDGALNWAKSRLEGSGEG